MTSSRSKKKCLALTRFELIAALLIILVLATILLLAVARVRIASRRSTCLANLRGFNDALQKYTADFHSLLPYGLHSPSLRDNFWTRPLSTYNANFSKMLQCPEAALPNPKIYTPGTATSPWNQPDSDRSQPRTGAYTINGWLYDTRFPALVYFGEEDAFLYAETRTDDPRPLPNIVDPASFYRLPLTKPDTLPTFADGIWPETFAAPYDDIPTDLTLGSGPAITFHMGQLFIARHGTAINVSFHDGHAETIPLQNLPTLHWQAQWIAPDPLPAIH